MLGALLIRPRVRDLVCCLLWALAGPAQACTVPVFRYALERWQPDAFAIVVFHSGPLTPDQLQLVAKLSGATPGRPANVRIELVDVEQAPAAQTDLVGDPLPWIVVRPPSHYPQASPLWAGSLTSANVALLAESPLRSALAERLLGGDSIVWLLVESGDAAADARAAETLTSTLRDLEQAIELPTIDPADIAAEKLSADAESLAIRFSLLRVSRNDPHERVLLETLLASESGLRDAEFAGQPMAFPVFGRGRVLYALIGAGIQPATIESACRFLTAGCQCTVKAENPGCDLLLAADWDSLTSLTPTGPAESPALVGVGDFLAPAGSAEPREARPADRPAPTAEAGGVAPSLRAPLPTLPRATQNRPHPPYGLAVRQDGLPATGLAPIVLGVLGVALLAACTVTWATRKTRL